MPSTDWKQARLVSKRASGVRTTRTVHCCAWSRLAQSTRSDRSWCANDDEGNVGRGDIRDFRIDAQQHRSNVAADRQCSRLRKRAPGRWISRTTAEPIGKVLEQVIAEIRSSHLDATIEAHLDVTEPVRPAPQRMSQMFSNLLGNAVAHGSTDRPIKVHATTQNHEFELSIVKCGGSHSTCSAKTAVPTILPRRGPPLSARLGTGPVHCVRNRTRARRNAYGRLFS